MGMTVMVVDRERIISLLKEMSDYFRECRSNASLGSKAENHFWELQSAAQDAATLLKEQEAKQIVRKQCKKEHQDGSIDYFAEWYCPHCKLLILRGFDNPSIKFCYKCGKPISWEGR